MADAHPCRLLTVIEEPHAWRWLDGLDLAAAGVAVATVAPASLSAADRASTYQIGAVAVVGGAGPLDTVPDFGQVVATLRQAGADACCLLSDGTLARLVGLAADLAGLPVFRLVNTVAELENLPRREKARPDLAFLTELSLLERATADQRYGSTLLPTGHPERDLVRPGGDSTGAFAGDEYGDGRAAERIRAAIERWRTGTLDPGVPQLSIVVPAYREAKNLDLVCGRLLLMLAASGLAAEILLVDDASPDDTYAQAQRQMWRSPRIRALTKGLPRGMGNAIRHGVRAARAPVITITMGDGSDDVDRIPEMFRMVGAEGFGLAIGSRYRHRRNYAQVPWLYRVWSRCFREVAGVLVGMRLKDYTNAFRTFDRRVIERYGLESGGFEISPELTFKAWFATGRVAEVDVTHLKRASGQSNFSFLRAGPGYGKVLIKAVVCRLTGRWFTLDW